MFRISLILVIIFQGIGLNAQDKRADYEAAFQKEKIAIDAATGANFTPLISSPGFEFAEPYVGIFPVEGKMTQLTNRFKSDSFAIGDTFYIGQVSWPRMNTAISLPDSEVLYAPSYKVKAKDFLLDAEGYQAMIAKLKKAKPLIKPVMPLWGALFCSPLDDDNENSKAEKYFLNTENSWSLHFKVLRQNETTTLEFGLAYSMNKDGDRLEIFGCAIPGKSYVQLDFADGTSFKKVHEGEENCYTLSGVLTAEDKILLKKKVVKIELSLSKRSFVQEITGALDGDIIGLKLDCVE